MASTALKDLRIYVEVFTSDGTINSSRIFKEKLSSMGATIAKSFSKSVNIIVFKDGYMSTFNKAKNQKIPLVSPIWVHKCEKKNGLVDPLKYPASDINEILLSPRTPIDKLIGTKAKSRRRRTLNPLSTPLWNEFEKRIEKSSKENSNNNHESSTTKKKKFRKKKMSKSVSKFSKSERKKLEQQFKKDMYLSEKKGTPINPKFEVDYLNISIKRNIQRNLIDELNMEDDHEKKKEKRLEISKKQLRAKKKDKTISKKSFKIGKPENRKRKMKMVTKRKRKRKGIEKKKVKKGDLSKEKSKKKTQIDEVIKRKGSGGSGGSEVQEKKKHKNKTSFEKKRKRFNNQKKNIQTLNQTKKSQKCFNNQPNYSNNEINKNPEIKKCHQKKSVSKDIRTKELNQETVKLKPKTTIENTQPTIKPKLKINDNVLSNLTPKKNVSFQLDIEGLRKSVKKSQTKRRRIRKKRILKKKIKF
ncbi:microcephalin [Anaeramoeba flamelloides]|uniref:Microcephalin n=1 Tax=Anaeramoeba flamelloides TaxID=1746091 RepID=A0AAV8A540_9EUKA|nr:microcephalin [Anaeramoeba flamelloides]